MTISLCPVLMNFSMQITHLNQKWSLVLFVFRQQRHHENPKKRTCFCLSCHQTQLCSAAFHATANLQALVSQCVCVRSVGWKGTAVQTKQLKKQSQIFGIQNDVNSLLFCTKEDVSPCVRNWVSVRTANPELSAMILSLLFFFFFR